MAILRPNGSIELDCGLVLSAEDVAVIGRRLGVMLGASISDAIADRLRPRPTPTVGDPTDTIPAGKPLAWPLSGIVLGEG